MPQHSHEAGTEELRKRYATLRGDLVSFKPEARRFGWTEAGKSAYVTLRRCLYLQHTKTPWQGRDTTALDDAHGAARCRDMLGSLEKASTTILEATWMELQRMVWRELQDFGVVMAPFDMLEANDTAAEAALVHIWARMHVWIALHRAPSDLLGNLNEALVLVMADDTLDELRTTVALLLEAWQEGLAQIGNQLAVALLADGGLNDQQRIPWLRNWRLYLVIHQHMAVWTNTHHVPCWQHQRAEPIYPSKPQLHDQLVHWGWAPQIHSGHGDGGAAAAPLSAGPQPLTVESVADVGAFGSNGTDGANAALGITLAHRAGVGAQSGAATHLRTKSAKIPGVTAAEFGDGDDTHHKVGMHAATQPRTLLTYFMALCADKAVKLVLPFLTSATAVGPFEALSTAWTADPEVLEVNAQLRNLCQKVVLQLHDALDEHGPEDALKKHTMQAGTLPTIAPTKSVPVKGFAAVTHEGLAAANATSRLPHSSSVAEAGSTATRTSGLGAAPRGFATAPSAAALVSLGGTAGARAEDARLSSAVLDTGTSGVTCVERGSTHMLELREALVPALPPRRVSRLCSNPGQLALQRHLGIAARSAPERLVGPDGVPTSAEEVPMKATLGAALVYGTCFYLHRTHSLLAAAWCMSNVSAPLDPPQLDRAMQNQGAARDERTVPVIAVSQLPVNVTSQRISAATAEAGAAALAADGSKGEALGAAACAAALARARAAVHDRVAEVGGEEVGSTDADAAAAQAPEAAARAAELASASAAAWVRCVERQVGELLAGEAAPQAVAGGAEEGDGDPARLKLDAISLLHFALLLSAGRVRTLAVRLESQSGPGTASTSADRAGGAMPRQLQLPPAPASVQLRSDGGGDAVGGTRLSHSDAPAATSALSEAYLASSSFRCSVLQLAVMSCAAATNRLAHVPNTHTPGSAADLKSLCLAHSDSVTLASACELLLAVAQALSLQPWAPTLQAGAGQQLATPPASAATHAEDASNGGAVSLGIGPPSGKKPRLPRKLSWRRSLRRILPAVMGGVAESPGNEGAGPAGARGCWASDAIALAPAPLQGLTHTVERTSTDEARKAVKTGLGQATDEAAAAARGLPPRGPGAGADARAAALPAAPQGRAARGSVDEQPAGDSRSGLGIGGRQRSSLSMPLAAQELLPVGRGGVQQGMASTVATPGPRVAAETGLLCLLHSLCEHLNATAARAADLLVVEMTHRAGMLYAPPKGKGAAPPSGIQPVMDKLLKPLREAVADLHPTTQAQLLALNFSAVLAVLRQHHYGALSSLSSLKGLGGRGGAPKGSEREAQLQNDLDVLRVELEQISAQVGAALRDPGCGTTTSGAASAMDGKPSARAVRQDFGAVRAELQAKIKTLERECKAWGGQK